MSKPSLLDEFSIGLDNMHNNGALVSMANAKWMSSLLIAISESPLKSVQSIDDICSRYRELSNYLLDQIGADSSDPRLQNLALQSLVAPAAKEIIETGSLNGQWINEFTAVIKSLPAFYKVSTSPVSASTSLGMTISNHFCDLYVMTNEFSFLRPQSEVVSWANDLIDHEARNSAQIISPREDHGSAYQNQLNVNRKLFISAYRTEAKSWIEMLNDHPESAGLYPEGIPLTGVQIRFREQINSIQSLLKLHPQTYNLKNSR